MAEERTERSGDVETSTQGVGAEAMTNPAPLSREELADMKRFVVKASADEPAFYMPMTYVDRLIAAIESAWAENERLRELVDLLKDHLAVIAKQHPQQGDRS
jgi:hypothetical protein